MNQFNDKTKAKPKNKQKQQNKTNQNSNPNQKSKPKNNNKAETKTLQNTFDGIGIIHPKMKMLSSSAHLHVIPNLYFLLLLDTKEDILSFSSLWFPLYFCSCNRSQLEPKMFGYIFFCVLQKKEIQVWNNKRQFFIYELSLV